MIPRRFKRKKFFVTNVGGGGWTHRREGGNSGLDYTNETNLLFDDFAWLPPMHFW